MVSLDLTDLVGQTLGRCLSRAQAKRLRLGCEYATPKLGEL
jgi:hypothetical protein